MKKILPILLVAIFLASCGQQVELNYEKLEAQYIELTPYWELVINQQDSIQDKNSAIRFARHYKEAREIISYYNTSGRDIGPAGEAKDAPSDTELLWNLRNSLNYASKYTNELANIK